MITIFANPRPFTGPFYNIQVNAIKSWLNIGSGVQVILFEDEEGTTGPIAKELGLLCINDAISNENGTALFDSVVQKVKENAQYDIICQLSADIILTSSFLDGVKKLKEIIGDKHFFMSGRRQDLDFKGVIDFSNKNWQEEIVTLAKKEGSLHGYSGMDYWMFPKTMDIGIPSFVIGRPGIDSWLVYKSRSLNIPVVDASSMVYIIHQNHNYPKKSKPFFRVEKETNSRLGGGPINLMTLREADYLLTPEGLKKPTGFIRMIFRELALFRPWRMAVLLKRKLWKAMGKS